MRSMSETSLRVLLFGWDSSDEEGEGEGGVEMEICREEGSFSLMVLGGGNAIVLGSRAE